MEIMLSVIKRSLLVIATYAVTKEADRVYSENVTLHSCRN